MIYSTLTVVLVGCLLGAVQLAIGLAIGLWLRRGDKAAAPDASLTTEGAPGCY